MRDPASMPGKVEKIFIAPRGTVDMVSVDEIEAVQGAGLKTDRYAEKTGHWSEYDECNVTLIRGEDLDEAHNTAIVKLHNGQHRRNVVTRNVTWDDLEGRRFRIGEATFEYDRPRPPCRYLAEITEPGMSKALAGRAGICVRVIESGMIRVEDRLEIL